MSNIYVHYPYCKQACHYCNFHFSTTNKGKENILDLIQKELEIRSNEVKSPLESIYFGGGSPSLISNKSLDIFLKKINKDFAISDKIEITMEVNPDDVTEDYLHGLKASGVNRLSLGVQSFFDKDLKLMNRAHSADQAHKALSLAGKYFDNFSLDLIYGMPYSSLSDWGKNLNLALEYHPFHISAYALTVEKKTALHHQIKKNKIEPIPEESVREQYDFLIDKMEGEGYINYEFSNFGKPGYFSVNNQNYWNGKAYLGLGPSAHSYDGIRQRSWNVSNNHLYAEYVSSKKLDRESETLNTKDMYNEYIMTGLRKIEGLSLAHIKKVFGNTYSAYFEEQVGRHLEQRNIFWDGDCLKVSRQAKFLTDGIASDLFII
jgi:oxygen-independent coproporphyrinogen-3 oxidase